MEDIIFSKAERQTRRRFMEKSMIYAGAAAAGSFFASGCAQRRPAGMNGPGRGISLDRQDRLPARQEKSRLSFVTGNDAREAAFNALKPLEDTVHRSLQGKQVVIKPNVGVIGPTHRHEATDVNQLRGILDFLKPLCEGQVIIAEGSASQALSMEHGFREYGYKALEKEYRVRLVDANDLPHSTRWILAGFHRPQPINLIDLYFDPNVYLISACRMKTSGGVLVTLSIKNISMGTPVCHYKQNNNPVTFDLSPRNLPRDINEKAKMHGGLGSKVGRELSYNIFSVAALGAFADLAVLDGVAGAEGDGPWNAEPVQHGVAIAGNDCVAADRLASELMGVDYGNLPYIQWCAQAGLGRDDLKEAAYSGPDYRPYIRKYRLNKNAESQIEWVRELRKNL
ncbi:MAG: DUF362 domain-containing protein [Candidatus Latescibacterota bacterium]